LHPRSTPIRHEYQIFGGIIKCAGCGRVMGTLAKGKKRVQCYHCKSQELKQVVYNKPSAWIRETTLGAQFAQIVAPFKLPDDYTSTNW
jgi:DNA-directed RNA polymerase subunit RPC12/RpoP